MNIKMHDVIIDRDIIFTVYRLKISSIISIFLSYSKTTLIVS